MNKFLPALSFVVAALLAAASPASADLYHGGNGGGQSGGQGSGDPMYNWSLGGLDSGSGTMQTVNDSGYIDITSISGTIDGYTIVGLYDGSNNGGYDLTADGQFAYNNVLYPSGNSGSCYTGGPGGGYLDLCGLMVTLTKGGNTYEANLFLDDAGKYGYALDFCAASGCGTLSTIFGGAQNGGDSFSIPEPASLALLGAGLVAAAGAVRRRKRTPKA